MAGTEVFRLTPEVGHCYEYAEATRKQGKNPNVQYFTTNPLRYVGGFVRSVRGGNSEYGGFCAYFLDNHGKEQRVDYSYDGNTCFREVPCIPSLQSLSRNVDKPQVDYSSMSEGDPGRNIIEGTVPDKMGGKSKRRRKTTKNKSTKKKKSIKKKRRKSISK